MKSPYAPATKKTIPVILVTGGLDYSTDRFQADPSFLLDAWDIDPQVGGGWAQRHGVIPFTPDDMATQVGFLGQYETTGVSQVIIGLKNGHIRYSPGLGNPSASVTTAFTGRTPFGVQAQGKFYIQDGVNVPRSWDGAALTTLVVPGYNGETWTPDSVFSGGKMPIGVAIETHQSRLWVLQADGLLRYSFPFIGNAGPEDWGSDDYFPIDPGTSGQNGVAMKAAGDRLYVFKSDSVYNVLGWDPDNFQSFSVSRGLGVLSPYAICSDGTSVFGWDAGEGLFAVSDGKASVIGKPLRRLIGSRITDPASVVLGIVDQQLWCSVVLDGERCCFVLDFRTKCWTKYRLKMSAFLHYMPNTGVSRPLGASWYENRPNRVLELNVDRDDDSWGSTVYDIQTYVQTAWLHDNLVNVPKMWDYTDYVVDLPPSASINVVVDKDWGTGGSLAAGSIEAPSSPPAFTFDSSIMTDKKKERLSPDSPLTDRPWRDENGADVMMSKDPPTTRMRIPFQAFEATAVRFNFYGPSPSKRHAVRLFAPSYRPSRRPL